MHASTPRVSVIIVNYRTYEELRACLGSLASEAAGSPQSFSPSPQPSPPLGGGEGVAGPLRAGAAVDRPPRAGESRETARIEVIVVDQGSDEAAARKVAADFPWCQIESTSRNRGFAAGVNCGASIARGTYLLLLNPDCSASRGFVDTLASWLDSDTTVGAIGPLIENEDGTVQQSARRFPDITTVIGGRTSLLTRLVPSNWFTKRNLLVANTPHAPIVVDWVSGACMMVRRNAFDAVGGMDEEFFMYWEDADLCCRLKKAGWSTIYHPDARVRHSVGRASAYSAERSLVAFHMSAYRYVRKHGSLVARTLAPIVLAGLEARLALKLSWRRARHAQP